MKRFILITTFLLPVLASFAQASSEKELLQRFDLLYNKSFPTVELEDENGQLYNTSWLKGKTVYVDFWFTQCPPCIKEIPYSEELKEKFLPDTNIVFLNICIENVDRKEAWKKMVQEKGIKGINLFYARNRPQKVNFIREYKVEDFPTYMLVSKEMKIIGYNAPRPSDTDLVEWSIKQAAKNMRLSEAYQLWKKNKSGSVKKFPPVNSEKDQ